MPQIPILKIEDFLIVTVQTELHNRYAVGLQTDILRELARTRAKGVLVDVTALDMVDSFLGRLIGETATMSRLMGARTCLVGLQPAVAITLTGLWQIWLEPTLESAFGRRLTAQEVGARAHTKMGSGEWLPPLPTGLFATKGWMESEQVRRRWPGANRGRTGARSGPSHTPVRVRPPLLAERRHVPRGATE